MSRSELTRDMDWPSTEPTWFVLRRSTDGTWHTRFWNLSRVKARYILRREMAKGRIVQLRRGVYTNGPRRPGYVG